MRTISNCLLYNYLNNYWLVNSQTFIRKSFFFLHQAVFNKENYSKYTHSNFWEISPKLRIVPQRLGKDYRRRVGKILCARNWGVELETVSLRCHRAEDVMKSLQLCWLLKVGSFKSCFRKGRGSWMSTAFMGTVDS